MIRHSRHITRGPRWAALRQQALRRDGWACVQCGARGRLEVDHIEPVRTHPGLAWALDNLQCLCPACHTRKTNAETGRSQPLAGTLRWRAFLRQLE